MVALVPTHALALPLDVNGLPIPNGDLNADGRLDAADALLEQQIATGKRVAPAELLDRGDIAPVNLAPKTPHAIAAGDVALLLRAIRGVDVDQDGLATDEEMAAGSSPFRIDSDRDGLGDFEEIRVLGSSPGNADSDGDGVLDAAEVNTQGTDPTDADTDGDGFADGAEIAAGTSPLAGVVYRHGDHLGSTALVTRSDGAVLQRVVYKPYGGLSAAQGADATPRLGFYFTGQRLESSVGLYDYGARFYDPALGRFLQPDSIVPSAYDPQSLNRYSYVENNPLARVDPSGNFSVSVFGGVVDRSGFSGFVGGFSSSAYSFSFGAALFAGGVPIAGLAARSSGYGLFTSTSASAFLFSSRATASSSHSMLLGFGAVLDSPYPSLPSGTFGRELAAGVAVGGGAVAVAMGAAAVVPSLGEVALALASRYPWLFPTLYEAAEGALGANGGGSVQGAARGAGSATNANRLGKALASEQQIGDVGRVIAGQGSKTAFRDAERIAREYGGSAADWVKKSSSSYAARDGTLFETHWVENLRTGQRVEFKTKFPE